MGAVGLGALSTGGGSVAPGSSAAAGDSTAGVHAPTSLVFGGSGGATASTGSAAAGANNNLPVLIAVGVVGAVALILAFKR